MEFLNKLKSFLFKSKNPQEASLKTAYTGRVRYFNQARGYGFIDSKEFDTRVFLHISEIGEKVRKGQTVKFSAEKTNKGWKARNVEVKRV